MGFLDYDGLLYFWQQIKTKFAAASHTHPAMTGASASAAGKAGFVPAPAKGQQGVFLRGDGTWASPTGTTYEPPPAKLGIGYGTCTTAESTKAKVSSISNYTLTAGGIVAIKFSYAVPAGSTLNITSKGAKAIYHKGAAITDGVIKAGDTATFVYSGQYHLVSIDRSNIEDGSVTTAKLANYAVTTDKLAGNAVTWAKVDESAVRGIRSIWLVAANSQTDQALTVLGYEHSTLTPAQMIEDNEYANGAFRLCWIYGTSLEVAPITFIGNLQTQAIMLYAKGSSSMASGSLGVDTSWTITALPTDADGVSY